MYGIYNRKIFPPPLWVYRSQECLSLMVDVLKVLCTSISLISWLRYTAHGAAACRSDCHSLSKWSSLLTRHDLLQKRSWSGIKRGHPRRGPPPSQHPVPYHRNSCWSLTLVHSGHKDFAERWPSHWQVTRVESFKLSNLVSFPGCWCFGVML